MCVIYGTLRLFNMSKVALLLLYPHYFGEFILFADLRKMVYAISKSLQASWSDERWIFRCSQ